MGNLCQSREAEEKATVTALQQSIAESENEAKKVNAEIMKCTHQALKIARIANGKPNNQQRDEARMLIQSKLAHEKELMQQHNFQHHIRTVIRELAEKRRNDKVVKQMERISKLMPADRMDKELEKKNAIMESVNGTLKDVGEYNDTMAGAIKPPIRVDPDGTNYDPQVEDALNQLFNPNPDHENALLFTVGDSSSYHEDVFDHDDDTDLMDETDHHHQLLETDSFNNNKKPPSTGSTPPLEVQSTLRHLQKVTSVELT